MASLLERAFCWTSFMFLLLEWQVRGAEGLHHTIAMRHQGMFPESMDWDKQGGHFVVGSMHTGAILSVSDAGVVEDLIVDADYAGSSAILGIKVDPPRNRLLAVVHTIANRTTTRGSGTPLHALAAYDLRSKRRLFLSPLLPHQHPHYQHDTAPNPSDPQQQQHQAPLPNDLCVDRRGVAYVTDSTANLVWKVDLDGTASVLVSSPLFWSQPIVVTDGIAGTNGLNGIACIGGGFLLVAQTNTGKLFRVGISEKTVGVVQLDDGLLPCIDGIALRRDGALVAVSTRRAWLLRTSDLWFTAHLVAELPLDPALNITSVAFREGTKPYVLHSHFHDMLAGSVDREEFTIQEISFPNDNDNPAWLLVAILLILLAIFGWRFQMNLFFKQYTKKRV